MPTDLISGIPQARTLASCTGQFRLEIDRLFITNNNVERWILLEDDAIA
jgi:hypothetical protein